MPEPIAVALANFAVDAFAVDGISAFLAAKAFTEVALIAGPVIGPAAPVRANRVVQVDRAPAADV